MHGSFYTDKTAAKSRTFNLPSQLTVQEKEEVPPIQKQSKISFISDKEVALFVQQKEPEQEDHEITVSD